MTNPTEGQNHAQVVHESNGIQFYVHGGEVVACIEGCGVNLPDGVISNLLLLDIAISLADIRNYGTSQERPFGQRTHNVDY